MRGKTCSLLAVLLLYTVSPLAADVPPLPAVCSAGERDAYLESVRKAIFDKWQPPRPNDTVSCIVMVVQNFRGEVRFTGVEGCDVDALVTRSLEDAAYEASPLPLPANRACHDTEVRVRIEHFGQPEQ